MKEQRKFEIKKNVIPNGLERYMTFNINNQLIFIYGPPNLHSSLDGLVKHLDKDNFTYFSQKFDSNVLDLVNQKGFYLLVLKSFKKNFQVKKVLQFV